MPYWNIAFAFVLFVLAYPTSATEVRLSVPDQSPCTAILVARPMCRNEPCESAATIRTPFHAPATVTLDLQSRASWQLSTEGDSCWAPPTLLESGELERPITMELQHAGTLTGMFAVPRGSPKLRRMGMRLSSERAHIESTIDCPVEGDRWHCVVPSAELDLRIHADGFVPHYLWNIPVKAAAVSDLGELELKRGASISGWVTVPKGASIAATVSLIPEVIAPGEPKRQPVVVDASPRGFFQCTGVPPGSFEIVARQKGWSSARISGFRVSGAREHVLKEPLRLEPMATVQVMIEPAVDPHGKPWLVSLDRLNPRSATLESVAHGMASVAGQWTGVQLEAGRYSLEVVDSQHSMHERRDVDIDSATSALYVSLAAVPVRGTLTAGHEPLKAALKFSASGASVRMQSDEDGNFTGVLPHEGVWQVQVLPSALKMVVQKVPLDIRRHSGEGTANADITLPGGRIEGTVADENGDPVDADIRVRREGALDVYTITDEKGAFRMVGVRPGAVTLEVTGTDDNSTALPYVVADGEGPSVRVVIERRSQVKGRLLTRSGLPIPGAVFRCLTPVPGRYDEVISGPDGTFAIPARKSVASVDVVILAAGFPVKIDSVPVAKGSIDIVVDTIGAVLKVRNFSAPPWPFIRRENGALVGLLALLYKHDPGEPPRGMAPGGITVELVTGTYTLCPGPLLTEECQARSLTAGTEVVVDGGSWKR